MCRFLSVSRSAYYSWLKRRGMEDKDGPLIEAIRTGQNINKNTYGYRRMTLWLNNFIGIHVNNKRVRRVMKKAGLQAEIRKKKKFKVMSGNIHSYENILNREFRSDRPNQKLVTDITYIRTKKGNIFLSMIKDLFDNSIQGYQISRNNNIKLVTDTLKKAFENNNIDGLGGKVLIAEPINHIEEFWGNLAWKLIMNFGDEPYNVDKCTLNDAFVTANCAYKRELLFKLEGFSNWFANNAEDVDFCWRAIKSGAKLMYTPDVQIHAHNVTTIKDVAKKSFRNGYSSSKLQKKYGSKINFDPNIYKMLGRNLIGLIKCEKDASLNVLELICHLTGKYYGSIKVRVINI